MSEKTKKTGTPSLEHITAEQKLLDTIQTSHTAKMSEPIGDETTSVLQKARTKLGLQDGEAADFNVSVGKLNYEEGSPADERIWVQARIKDGNQTNLKHVAVGSVLEGAVFPGEEFIIPEDGFVAEEVFVLRGMANGLRMAKELGALSQLDSTLGQVRNPHTSIMRMPPTQNNS